MTQDWDERVVIEPQTDWFWDPLASQHVGRYLWARSILKAGYILDVACGTGYGSALLGAPGRRVVGIDASSDAVECADRYYASESVSFEVGDVTRLPMEPSSVDFVVSFETIEHLAEPMQFVAEVARVLRPGGTFLLSTPDRAIYSRGRTDGRSNNPFHPSEMTRPELLALLNRAFVVRDVLGQMAFVEAAPSKRASRPSGRSALARALKRLIITVTSPALKYGSIGRWLFPRVRQQYVPRTSISDRSMYIVVRAEKR